MIATSSKISRETLCQIVEAATLAPSAENLQPWRFELGEGGFTICLDARRRLESDVDQMLALTGIGTCLENAVIAASAQGLRTEVEVVAKSLPSAQRNELVPLVRLEFTEGGEPDALSGCLESRSTSRRMDPRRRVAPAILRELESNSGLFPGVSIHWVAEEQLDEFAALVGLGNRIRFEHKPFHAELYHSLRFTAAEARQSCDGLDVATLQLPLGVAGIMRALRTWPRMKLANTLGFSRGVARQATQEVVRSGAVGFITVSRAELDSFILGGRSLERLWLSATRLGLCFHPTASLPVFLAHARTSSQQLLPRHRELAADMSKRFCRLFPTLDGQTAQMAFRVGYGPRPPIRSLRRPWKSVVEFSSGQQE
jgi:Nitroreductase family